MPRFDARAENWDEFRWEREIRRDERRISCYFRELPDCLDLPGEEDAIFKRLMSQGDLVPAAADPAAMMKRWGFGTDDEEDEGDYEDDPRRRPGNDAVEQIDRLAADWNALWAMRKYDSLHEQGIALICLFGKLLARTADMVDTDENCLNLKISLAKRSLSDLNDLAGALEAFSRKDRRMRGGILPILESLQHVRERILSILEETRAAADRRTAE